MTDPVHRPAHYTRGSIEVRDFVADQQLNFNRGSAVKYICRAGYKDPSREVEDLEKAISCIRHEIARLRHAEEFRKYGASAARMCFELADADMRDVLVDQGRIRLGYPIETQLMAERAYGEGRVDGDWRRHWRDAGERLLADLANVSLTADSPPHPPQASQSQRGPAGGEAPRSGKER